jgi:hypothetical protein
MHFIFYKRIQVRSNTAFSVPSASGTHCWQQAKHGYIISVSASAQVLISTSRYYIILTFLSSLAGKHTINTYQSLLKNVFFLSTYQSNKTEEKVPREKENSCQWRGTSCHKLLRFGSSRIWIIPWSLIPSSQGTPACTLLRGSAEWMKQTSSYILGMPLITRHTWEPNRPRQFHPVTLLCHFSH